MTDKQLLASGGSVLIDIALQQRSGLIAEDRTEDSCLSLWFGRVDVLTQKLSEHIRLTPPPPGSVLQTQTLNHKLWKAHSDKECVINLIKESQEAKE